jgi:hypothetical protein
MGASVPNLRADALRGTLSRPLADLHKTSIGEQMARIVGDVECARCRVREFTIETWDYRPLLAFVRGCDVVIDAQLTLQALAPVPLAMLIAHASALGKGANDPCQGSKCRADREHSGTSVRVCVCCASLAVVRGDGL